MQFLKLYISSETSSRAWSLEQHRELTTQLLVRHPGPGCCFDAPMVPASAQARYPGGLVVTVGTCLRTGRGNAAARKQPTV